MINKLIANIKKTNAPIVVGLDPMLNYVPEHVQKKAFAESPAQRSRQDHQAECSCALVLKTS